MLMTRSYIQHPQDRVQWRDVANSRYHPSRHRRHKPSSPLSNFTKKQASEMTQLTDFHENWHEH
jgi:hypothetical protein